VGEGRRIEPESEAEWLATGGRGREWGPGVRTWQGGGSSRGSLRAWGKAREGAEWGDGGVRAGRLGMGLRTRGKRREGGRKRRVGRKEVKR